ncbi:PEP-CTERM sorting domain-containing protein [Sulfuriroseicoccus oceanibius]|uniref:PEP-CTERM sorting domain-containing protein n=1 Tax=Sulfuriroseicoccus oceanibius TaxID=2707525 RepID=A0A6B3L5B5_9BACT|nr:PEP-CTERM sorting domain-containing protein [Sulfuriroseicoccus oceanibius]QQL44888.1 PEP-CTERM sorting domain-containing protein [Sulfuriroseicoccus oceanibius]
MIKQTLAALVATTLGASAATIIASTSFETSDGFPNNTVTGGFNVVTSDGATWTAGGATGNYAGAWAGQALTGTQSAVIGNVSTTDQFITVDAAGADGVGSITFSWERFTTTSTPLQVQWTTDTIDGNELWNTVSTIDLTGPSPSNGGGGWTTETIAINQTGDVKVRLFLSSGATNTGGASFDDISVTAVPEPSSAALFGLGGLALVLRRRR